MIDRNFTLVKNLHIISFQAPWGKTCVNSEIFFISLFCNMVFSFALIVYILFISILAWWSY